MFFDKSTVRAALEHMIRKLTSDLAVREDLMQEGLIELWIEEVRWPGQTQSWYLQRCKSRLKGELRKGRSIDSYKRRKGQTLPAEQFDSADSPDSLAWEASFGVDEDTLDRVSAREIATLLLKNLPRIERRIFVLLIRGTAAKEIARLVKHSSHFVTAHREVIKSVAIRCGIEPPAGHVPIKSGELKHLA